MNRRLFLKGAAALALGAAAGASSAQAAPAAEGLPLRVRSPFTPTAGRAVSEIADPYDLRPAVDALLENIAHAARNLPAGKPLVVLLGESHPVTSHIALQYMLIDRMRQAGTHFASGAELPHNFCSKYLGKMLDIPLSPAEHAKISAADKDGKWALATRLADRPDFAPVAAHTLLSLYRRAGISARFNDASFGGARMLLDEADPLTGALIDRHAPDRKGTKIFVTEPLGIALRNRAIVHNTLQHIADTGAGIYILPCGRNHVFGNVDSGFSYDESLTALLKAQGAAVLPVYHVEEGETLPFPPEAAADTNAIAIEGAATDYFMGLRAGEVDTLEKLAASSRHPIDIFRADKPHTDQTEIKDMLQREAPAWIAAVK